MRCVPHLRGVLLHVVEAALPVDGHSDRRADCERRRGLVQDEALGGAADVADDGGARVRGRPGDGDRAGVGGLAAPFGEEHRVLQLDQPEIGGGRRRGAFLLLLLLGGRGRLRLLLAGGDGRGEGLEHAVALAGHEVGRVALRRRAGGEAVVVEGVGDVGRGVVVELEGADPGLEERQLGGEVRDRHRAVGARRRAPALALVLGHGVLLTASQSPPLT